MISSAVIIIDELIASFHHILSGIQLNEVLSWFKNYELIEPSLRIYIDTLYNKHLYIQNQFMNYVFALEIYHKRKFNDTIPVTKTINHNRLERVLN